MSKSQQRAFQRGIREVLRPGVCQLLLITRCSSLCLVIYFAFHYHISSAIPQRMYYFLFIRAFVSLSERIILWIRNPDCPDIGYHVSCHCHHHRHHHLHLYRSQTVDHGITKHHILYGEICIEDGICVQVLLASPVSYGVLSYCCHVSRV